MSQLLSLENRTKFNFILHLFFVLFFLTSPFLLTVTMVAFVVLALLHPNLKATFQAYLRQVDFLAVNALFVVISFSALYSQATPYLWDRLRVGLPFLFLPFAFFALPPLSKRQYQLFFYILLAAVFIASLGTFINYLTDYQAINKGLLHGRPMPTPIHHIRFSLLIAYTILIGLWLFKHNVIVQFKGERFLILGMTAFLFLFLHILSVRSGIVVFYAAFGLLILRHIFKTKQFLLGITVLVGLFALPLIAYKTLPSFKNRIDYALYDLKKIQSGESLNYSDGERVVSLKVGLAIGNNNPLFGVGIGNLNNEVERMYREAYPQFPPKRPHNQFLFFYAATGIVGTVAFLSCLLIPFFYQKNYQQGLLLAFYSIVFLSFLVENTIGTAIGTAYFIFFLLVNLKARFDGLFKDGKP